MLNLNKLILNFINILGTVSLGRWDLAVWLSINGLLKNMKLIVMYESLAVISSNVKDCPVAC